MPQTNRTETVVRSTLVSPIGSGGLRARLVRAGDAAAFPFVVVHEGRFARILLAELVGDDGVAQTRFAWKLRVDEVGDGAPTNGDLDRTWQQERAELLRVRSPHVVAPVAVPTALTRSPPVFYCQRIDSYFHPVCPDTGAVLRVCRDPATLAAAGLPAYDEDTVRYLHHGDRDGPQVFYRVGPAQDHDHAARIGDFDALVRGWSRIAHSEQPSPELPCQTCEHRGECYPQPETAQLPASRHLRAVSFYDVDALAIELATTDFDTAVERLGGGLSADGEERAWWNVADVGARALECVRLKLSAFADICRGVQAVHDSGRPHLGVSPANVVAFESAGSSLPSNWRLRLALTDLGGARPVPVPGSGEREVLWQPGLEISQDEVSRRFLAPLLRSLEGGSVTMPVTCVGDGGRMVVEVHRAGVPSFVLPGDVVLLQPVDGEGETVSAKVDEVGSRAMRATILSDPVAERICEGKTIEARLSFVRRSGPSADLYGLGMMLLRMLLVHDEQTLTDVAETVEACLQQMGVAAADPSRSLADRWLEILDGDTGKGRFASWHVLHDRAERQALFDLELQARVVIPRAIWRRLLILAGKLMFASPLAPRDESGTASPLRDVLDELAVIERQFDVELFGTVARNRTVAKVCAERLVTLKSLPQAPSPSVAVDGDDARGFVLAVGRVGESGIRQYYFTQERVTIGRREGENLLCLTDPMVSSRHAMITWEEGEFVVSDCGSTNGTEVDGIRLPVEVPHPLDDASVIHIRPYVLSFRRGRVSEPSADADPVVGADELFEQLRAAYAEAVDRGEQQVHRALSDALDRAQKASGRRALVAGLEAVVRIVVPEGAAVADPDPDAEQAVRALEGLRRLAAELGVVDELASSAHVVEFAVRLAQIVEVSSHWLSRLLGSADEGAQATSADLRRKLLDPVGDPEAARTAGSEVDGMFRHVASDLGTLLQDSLTSLARVRERLAPEQLVDRAGDGARIRLTVQAAASSQLWKTYREAFAQLSGTDDVEARLRRWLAVLDQQGT